MSRLPTSHASRRAFLKRLVLGASVLGACLALLEGGLRLAGYLPALPFEPDAVSANGYYWISDPILGFRNRSHGCYVYRDIRSAPRSTTDHLGCRNGYGWGPDSAPAVVMVGDSVTFCAEVNDAETVASQLCRKLERKGRRVAVVNAGVRGYNTLQSKRLLENCLDRFPSLRVAVYCYCDNDWFENLLAREYWPAQAPVVAVDKESGRCIEVEVEDTAVVWGGSFLPAVAGHRAERDRRRAPKRFDRRLRDWVRERCVVAHLVQSAVSRGRQPAAPTRGGGEDSRRRYPDVGDGSRAMLYLLREMKALCEGRGVTLLITEVRTRGTESRIAEWCAVAELPFVDSRAFFPGPAYRYQARLREGGYDPHLGARGAEAFARALLPAVEGALHE